MSKTPRRKNVKELIKISARNTFAKKGFDGAGIQEIAEGADVPKSLIYYHFKSKNDILSDLIKGLLDDYRKLIKKVIEDEEGRLPRDIYITFLEKNSDLVRIMMIESFKNSQAKPMIFEVVETLMEFEDEKDTTSENLVAEFFTSIIPAMAFTCFSDSWASNFNVDKNQLKKEFKNVHEITHGAYHK